MTRRPEIPFDVLPCTDGKTVNIYETDVGVARSFTVEQAIYLADRLVDAVTGRVRTPAEKEVLDVLLGRVRWAS